MVMEYELNENSSMEHITFTGLNGNEFTGNAKSALDLLKIENPAVTFAARVKAGEYDDTPEDEYVRTVNAVDFMSSLWCYPDERESDFKQGELNVLMLLANALETVSRQQAIINRQGTWCKEKNHEKEMMDTWRKAKR